MNDQTTMQPDTDHRADTDPRATALLRIYRLLRLLTAATAVILTIWLLSDVLTVVFAAALLAVILHGLSGLVSRASGLPHWASLIIVMLVLLVAFGGLGFIAGPQLSAQATSLRDALTDQARGLHDRLTHTHWGQLLLQQVPKTFGGDKDSGGGSLPAGLAGSVAGFLGSAFGLVGTVVVILIAGIYFAASPATYVNGMLRLVPTAHRNHTKELSLAAGSALWSWSAGQALDMAVVGTLSGVGLWLIGVPLALVLGIVAGLMNFVPYIGAIAGSIPAVILAFSVGSTQGLETIGLYLVIQGFEGNVMAPLIQRRAVDLPPALTILAQTAFGSILGISGLIFATPLTAVLLAVMEKATTPLDAKDKV